MNFRLVSKSLGLVTLLIGAVMVFSLPWAFPLLGRRRMEISSSPLEFETRGFLALLASIVVCAVVGTLLYRYGRKHGGTLYRKEAMAIVGLSWVMATLLGAMPFYFSQTYRSCSVRLYQPSESPLVFALGRFRFLNQWEAVEPLRAEQFRTLQELINAGAVGLSPDDLNMSVELDDASAVLRELVEESEYWEAAILFPEDEGPDDRRGNVRLAWVRMGIADSLFESQSGFSTTGATVISDLEDPVLVPHCILFWRSSTHYLGGMGIIVLFVTVLGHGSAGKAMMRAEMPGPTKEGATARMQHTAWLFAAMYSVLNLILAVILFFEGLSPFDALCHAFGTMATGGFSTYNASLGHFQSAVIDYTVILFMLLAGTNFTLLALVVMGQPDKLWKDVEFRVYMAVIFGISSMVVVFGLWRSDFAGVGDAIRYSLFQVVSIVTTTGYGTHDFDDWNSFGRGVLFLLMFVGGCAGSTGGGLKVIRHILFLRILRLEIERSFHPTVVRPLKLGGKPVDDPDLRKNILVYFSIILVLFVFSWMFIVAVEPDDTWGTSIEHKLIDSASGVAATLNNIGPGLGTVGATQNYAPFSPVAKILFVWLMMLGRLELFSILVLFSIRFWRNQ